MPAIRGNYGEYGESLKSGSGTVYHNAPFGHITVAGKAGDEVRILSTHLFLKFDQIFQGIALQAVGGSVDLKVTLAPLDLTLNPEQDAGGHWIVDPAGSTVSPGTVLQLKTFPTAIKLKFSSPAIVYVMGV